MAYNEELEKHLLPLTSGWENVEAKKMFGGIGIMVNGNMCVGIHKDNLVIRVGEEKGTELLSEDNIRVFDITGRPMKGWLMVSEAGWRNERKLKRLVTVAREFVDTLPAK